jgi:hypothetical protein
LAQRNQSPQAALVVRPALVASAQPVQVLEQERVVQVDDDRAAEPLQRRELLEDRAGDEQRVGAVRRLDQLGAVEAVGERGVRLGGEVGARRGCQRDRPAAPVQGGRDLAVADARAGHARSDHVVADDEH